MTVSCKKKSKSVLRSIYDKDYKWSPNANGFKQSFNMVKYTSVSFFQDYNSI